jgi:hypothetical protein
LDLLGKFYLAELSPCRAFRWFFYHLAFNVNAQEDEAKAFISVDQYEIANDLIP